MSYQVLARKWRPKSFTELVGQEHVVRALTHALETQRLHHAYLFTGTRGVGKTTIARILAKSLNCETGVTATPCGKCSACVEIDAGRFVDLLEVDAATNTRVDEMRQLLENAVYAPTRGRYKVYVIDEVHMLSNSAFNAMLKTLEEPPEHMKFVLATTDPQKIPVTVLSRCLQFNLKQMAGPAIVDHLIGVCDEENVQTTPEALRLIAHAAHGSMRDALSLLDQTIAYCSGVLQPDAVRSMLGSVDRDFLVAILEHLGQGDLQRAIEVASDIQARSLSFDEALGELATLLHQIALLQCVPAAELPGLIDRERIAALAERLAPDAVQLYYQIALHGRHDLALAPDDYAGFTMALMRMALFEPQTAQGSAAGHGTEASGAPPMSAGKSVGKSAMAAARARADRGLPEERPAAQPAPRGDFDGDWPSLVRRLGLSGLAKQLAERCALVKHEAGRFELAVGAADRALAENPYQDRLKQALQEHFGRVVSLSCTVGEVKGDTVAAADEAARQAKTREAASLMEGDSFVRSLKSEFGATIDSIRPMK